MDIDNEGRESLRALEWFQIVAGQRPAELRGDALEVDGIQLAQLAEPSSETVPVLKQAGVVDSGGKGLFFILEGFLRYIRNESVIENPNQIEIKALTDMIEEESVEPGQDYEVIVDFIPTEELILEVFYRRLEDIGVSIQE